jgi:hypothetical protein
MPESNQSFVHPKNLASSKRCLPLGKVTPENQSLTVDLLVSSFLHMTAWLIDGESSFSAAKQSFNRYPTRIVNSSLI